MTAADAEEALRCLNPDTGYDEWVGIGMALHHGDFAFDLWDSWSTRGNKYKPNECRQKWDSFSPDGGITMGTLIHLAKNCGWDYQPRSKLASVSVPPAFPKVSGTADEAHRTIRHAIGGFWSVVANHWQHETDRLAGVRFAVNGVETEVPLPEAIAPIHVIQGALASGKSHAIREEAVDYLSTNRDAIGVIAVPAHKLLDEYEERLAMAKTRSVRVAVFRGIERPDPQQPGLTMCWRLDAARTWTACGAPLKQLCKNCPSNGKCGTSKQREREADLWLMPSNMIFGGLPETIHRERLKWLVVDEDPSPFAVRGVARAGTGDGDPDNRELLVASEALEARQIPNDDGEGINPIASLEYAAAAKALEKVMGPKRLSVHALRQAGMTEDLAAAAVGYTWRLRSRPQADGGLDDEVIIAVARAVEHDNATVRKLGALWMAIRRALAEDLTNVPGVHLTKIQTEGGKVPALELSVRRNIGRGWLVPTLLLDATADPEIVEAAFQARPTSWAVAVAALPESVSVRQISDTSFGKSMLFPDTSMGRSAVNAATNNVQKLLWYIEARAGVFRGMGAQLEDGMRPDVLVVGQKELVRRLRCQNLPENVETAHFGNLAGLDRWKGVRCLIVVGRRMIPPNEVEKLAEVLGTRDVVPNERWYPTRPLGLRRRASDIGTAEKVERHSDKLAEALRFRAAEGEIIQAIGRARGIRRNAATPLQIDILGRAPLPGIEVDEVLHWTEALPTVAEHLWARCCLRIDRQAYHGKADLVAALLPDRFTDAKAVRSWCSEHRDRSLSESSIDTIIEKSDSERRWYGQLRLPGTRYAVKACRYSGGHDLPVPMVVQRSERRGKTILTRGNWIVESEC
ncbi:PriCT-2 domain-containing protein [Minwuia thermotolerans]|uniref:PriCT-2 domain-containing protein n=1 Tax=Minwuia thermotolerans TaxID=2056226 RepID=UPI003B969626